MKTLTIRLRFAAMLALVSTASVSPASAAPASAPKPIGLLPTERQQRFDNITAGKVRLSITQAAACPALSEVGLYAEPCLTSTTQPGEAK